MEEQNNIIQEPKKKSPILLIILMIVLGFGCIVGGFLLGESGILSGDKKDTEEKSGKDNEPVVTNYDVTDAKVSKLIDNLLNYKQLVMCGKITLLATDKKMEAKDIDNEGAWNIALADLGDKDAITLDEVTNTIKKYLGKDYTFTPASSFPAYCTATYEYDESTKTYNKKPVDGGCGGTCGPATSSYRMVKAVDTDGVLKINVKVVFGSEGTNGNPEDYYSDYARTNVIGNASNKVENLYDKGADYLFTFKLEDGNYVFVSSEPVKD